MIKTAELSTKILDFYFNKLKYEQIKNAELKEIIKSYYFKMKEETLKEDGDFDRIVIDDVILHEKLTTNYIWTDDFYEEIIDCGMAHLVLKHGNQLNKRFDLSPFELPKDPNNQKLHFSVASVGEEYKIILRQHEEKLEVEKQRWSALSLEELVDSYIRSKMTLDISKTEYNIQKDELLETMKDENVSNLNGFSIKEEATNYDFSKMYGVELEEKVEIATNGVKSIDLLSDTPTEITEHDLFDWKIVKKSIRKQERIELFHNYLGEKYYFVSGRRKEKEIIKRFPISTGKVEEAIDNGLMNKKVLEVDRTYKSDDDLKLNFEIITMDTLNDRKFMFYEKMKSRNALISGSSQSIEN